MFYAGFLLLIGLFTSPQQGQADDAVPVVPLAAALPPGDNSPVLRLESEGPRSYVTGLAFGNDGRRLYSAGWDKSVQVWNLNENGKFEASPMDSLRVPTGGGPYGTLNAMAVSEDGKWLAVGGQGYMRGRSGERNSGWVLPSGVLGEDEQYDEGLIYVFNTETRVSTLLRGHRGPVMAMTFVRGRAVSPPELISVAEERTNGHMELHPVIRCWDVANSSTLDSLTTFPTANGAGSELLPSLRYRPGLSAWSTGPGAQQIRVAIAWGDNRLRLWDVRGDVTQAESSPATSDLLTVVPMSGDRLFTGGNSQAGVWTIPPSVNRAQFTLAQTASVNQPQQLPNLVSAAALIPKAGASPARIAMVVSKYESKTPDTFESNGLVGFRLMLVSATSPFNTLREIDLQWRAQIRQPSLAISPDGTWLAVAGNQLNDIAVFKVADFAKPAQPVPQLLRSIGTIVRDAMFVTNVAGNWGLQMLRSDGDLGATNEPKSLVLDILQRQILPSDKTWSDASMPSEWKDSRVPGKLVLQHLTEKPIEVSLPKGHVVTSFAVCPVTQHCSVPLVAVASHEKGQPRLQIYRADTGVPLRWCEGHTEMMRALHFSNDGRMLLSVGADRLVCVWTVTDLDRRTIGKHGQLAGLVVQSPTNRLMVIESPDRLPLKVEDEIVSISPPLEVRPNVEVRPNERPQPLKSAKEFYQMLLGRIPGEKVEVTIRRNGNVQTVSCTVDQAIDGSKPLFSIFVAPGDNQGEWEWIGWHPLGLFSTRSDQLDRLLGWHFNTGEPDRPASFVGIGEYREKFYDKDLLFKLIRDQVSIPQQAVENPKISAGIRREKSWVDNDFARRPQIRSKNSELVAEITGISASRIESVEAEIDAGQPFRLEPGLDREWVASLAQVPWTRGKHSIVVRLKTYDLEVSEKLDVDFRPAAPVIEWEPPWKEPVNDGQVAVKAKVIPSEEPMRIRLYREGDAVPVQTWGPTNQVVVINEMVKLNAGDNRLTLKAWNDTAPAVDRELETATTSTLVVHPAGAPNLFVNSVTSRQGDLAVALATDDRGIYVSRTSEIQIRGTISATGPLDLAAIQCGNVAQTLKGFAPGVAKKLAFDEALELKPGSQVVMIQAGAGGQRTERALNFLFLPPLTKIKELTAKTSLQKVLPEKLPNGSLPDPDVLYSGYHDSSVVVTAILEGQLDPATKYELFANNVPVANVKETLEPGRRVLTATVNLDGGKNTVRLDLKDQWNQADSRHIELEYKRPPEILAVMVPAGKVEPPINVTCRVRSPIPLRSATVQIGELKEHPQTINPVPGTSDEWSFDLKIVGAEEGNQDLIVTAVNDDGICLKSMIRPVKIQPPPIPPPQLALFKLESSTDTNPIKFEYSVASRGPTKVWIDVAARDRKLDRIVITEDQVPIDRTMTEAIVFLGEGANTVQVMAISNGHTTTQKFEVSYTPRPVTVEVTSVDGILPRTLPDKNRRRILDHPVKGPTTLLSGRVIVPKQDSAGELNVKIWVNGFAMKPEGVVVPDPKKTPHVGTFEALLVLGQTNNKIEIDVYRRGGDRVAKFERQELEIRCATPEKQQELYVLLMGRKDREKLLERAHTSLLKGALVAEKQPSKMENYELWKSAVFERIYVYDAVEESDLAIQGQLRMLIKQMQNTQSRNGQPIAMIYYQGQITLTDTDFYFGEMDPALVHESRMVTGKYLEKNLVQKCGAHVVFLDLQQNTQNLSQREIWPKSPNLGIAVANWNGAGEQPENARLVSILQKTLPGIRKMGELGAEFKQPRNQIPNLELVDNLDNLRELRVGKLE